MPKIETNAKYTYSAAEFNKLISENLFNGEDIKVDYIIQEVGGDYLDRYPGTDTVTKVVIRKRID